MRDVLDEESVPSSEVLIYEHRGDRAGRGAMAIVRFADGVGDGELPLMGKASSGGIECGGIQKHEQIYVARLWVIEWTLLAARG